MNIPKDPAKRGFPPAGMDGVYRGTVTPGIALCPSTFPAFRVSPTWPDFSYAQGKPQKHAFKLIPGQTFPPEYTQTFASFFPHHPPSDCQSLTRSRDGRHRRSRSRVYPVPVLMHSLQRFISLAFFYVYPPFSGQRRTKTITADGSLSVLFKNLSFTAFFGSSPHRNINKSRSF